MSMPLNCEQFSDRLADYLEGDLPPAVRAAMESHADACAGCGALLADITALRHDAAALPALQPSRDLWGGIAERIDARVLPLAVPAATRSIVHRTWMRPAVAAAALVLITAGITHVLTRVSYGPTLTVASAPSRPAAAAALDTPAVAQAIPTAVDGVFTSTKSAQPAATTSPRRLAARESGPARAVPAINARNLMRNEEPVYDQEIVKLRQIVRQRRSELDPKTVAVLEQSIAVIDSAIAQSRAALANDPASGFLATQLNHSLEKKVELLRTAALLPART
ncbi:MAG: zf-HC2 domain-containing protein [Gemmatimonadota bacterium]|nr:zf-HC2 domain-containing protein [Gemmatimonadota bacterium]